MKAGSEQQLLTSITQEFERPGLSWDAILLPISLSTSAERFRTDDWIYGNPNAQKEATLTLERSTHLGFRRNRSANASGQWKRFRPWKAFYSHSSAGPAYAALEGELLLGW